MHPVGRILPALLLSLLLPPSLTARQAACNTPSVSLSTGVNPATGSFLPMGSPDPDWTVIDDPFPSTVEPRPADVFTNPNAAWTTIQGSQWIGSQNDSTQDTNGDYYYQYCFCLRDGFSNATLLLDLRADDQADLFLNQTEAQIKAGAAAIKNGAVSSFKNPNPDHLLYSGPFKNGKNCLIAVVHNTSSVATGLDIAGSITASGPDGKGGLLKPACCQATGSICGMKWNDLNHDGVHQPAEPALPNWTIQLSNGQTALTDQFGDYCFSNLTPGTYAVEEQAQAGWFQTLPAAPRYVVTVGAGTAVGGRDFGNCHGQGCAVVPLCLTAIGESVLCATDGTSDYLYSFQVTNNSTTNVFQLVFVDLPPPVTVTSNVNFTGEPGGFLAPGKTSLVKTVRIHGAKPGSLAFRFLLLDQNGSQCCATSHTLDIPPCDCAQVLTDFACRPVVQGGRIASFFDYSFTIQNLTHSPPVSYALVTTTTPGLLITQSGAPIAPPLGFGETTTQLVTISGPAAMDEATVCLKLSVHDASLVRCCSIDRCVTLHGTCFIPGTSPDLNISLSTGLSAAALAAASPGAPQQGDGDPNWTVTVPRPVRPAQSVLSPDSDWPWAVPGTEWISRDPSGASVAGVSTIRYRRCFCIGAGAREATLSVALWADDRASLLLNGVPIAGPGGNYAAPTPLSVQLTGAVGTGEPFAVGVNCLVAVVHESGAATGLDLFGSVRAVGGACTPP